MCTQVKRDEMSPAAAAGEMEVQRQMQLMAMQQALSFVSVLRDKNRWRIIAYARDTCVRVFRR